MHKILLLFFRVLEKSARIESIIVSKNECIFYFSGISIYIKPKSTEEVYVKEKGACIGYLFGEVGEKEKLFLEHFVILFQKTIVSFDNLYALLIANKEALEEIEKFKVFFYENEDVSQDIFFEYKEKNIGLINQLNDYVQISTSTPVKIEHYLDFYLYIKSKFIKNPYLKVLEIGAYFGFFVDLLSRDGIEIDGVEKFQEISDKVVSANVMFQDFFDLDSLEKYDCIVAVNFFHEDLAKNSYENRKGLNLDDIVPMIEKCLSLLIEGGELVFNYDDTEEGRAVLSIIQNMGYPLYKMRGGILVLEKK